MKQMDVPAEMKIEMNYEDADLPEAVKTLKPLVFKDGDSFCCLLGPDPQEGVFGCGPTQQEALNDWEANMRKRIIYHKAGDEVAQFIEDNLNASAKDIG
jgi:hypothetical protein